MATRILILGGGFAGVSAARALVSQLRRRGRLREPAPETANDAASSGDVEVVLVNRENYFVFQPLLADVLPGTIQPTHSVVPLRRMLRGVDIEVAVVQRIDPARRIVELRRRQDGSRVRLGYDHLVLALGSVTDFRTVAGMAEHALGLRTLGDAIYLRNRALAMLEEADLEADPDRRRRLLTFVVVGGGSTGVEVAAELRDQLKHAARAFRETRLRPRVLIVHSRDRLLPSFEPKLGRHATRKVREIGIQLLLGRRLTAVDADGVELDDGTLIPAATVISTVGNAPHPILRGLTDSEDDAGWPMTRETLELPGLENTWAVGDCASIPHPRTGEPAPATAQHAVRQGPHLARNILRVLDGEAPEPYHYHSKGMLVSLGTLRGVGSVVGVRVTGAVAWFLWRGYYLSQLPTLERRIRVGVDWLVDLFLPRDIVQIDIRRSVTRPDPAGVVEDRGLELPVEVSR